MTKKILPPLVFLLLALFSSKAMATEGATVPVPGGASNAIGCDLYIDSPSECPSPDQWTEGRGTVCCSKYNASNVGDIAYIRGNLPLIISNPHGGYLTPSGMEDRNTTACGGGNFTTYPDPKSQEYTREVRRLIGNTTGRYPHVIFNRVRRDKLDANRNKSSGACGYLRAGVAWDKFHEFIDFAKAQAVSQCGKGLYLDFHTMSANSGWVQLGYLLGSGDFNRSDSSLNDPTYINKSSLRSLVQNQGAYFPEIIRGQTSIGGELASRAITQVFPNPTYPNTNNISWDKYNNGGFNTVRHGSRNGGTIDGLQIEINESRINEDRIDGNRDKWSRALAASIIDFSQTHYGFDLAGGVCGGPGSSPSPSASAGPSPSPSAGSPNPSVSPSPALLPSCFNSAPPIDGGDVKSWAVSYLSSLFDTISDSLTNSFEFGYLVSHWGQVCQN